MDTTLPAAPPAVDRLIAVNAGPALLEALSPLTASGALELVIAANEAELLATLTEAPAVVLVGLGGQRLSPLSVLRALAHARLRPAIVLVGPVEPRLYENIEALATRLRLDSIAHVLNEADAARLASSMLRADAARALPREADLRRAIEEGELTLHYQPKFAAEDERSVLGVEALVRWNHPELGLLRPDRFLPLAERAGLMMDLTDFTLTEAMRQHAAFRAHGLDVPVAVNLAEALIRDGGFPERLERSFRQFDVSPRRFTLEVKESGAVADHALLAEVFTRLRQLGVGLALDDYGAGLSSLTEL